jgi:subtilisin family serine protease
VAAAGNGFWGVPVDACTVSPARLPDGLKYLNLVITVGASDLNDDIFELSNFGKCVDIIAPGIDILSTFPFGKENKKHKHGSNTGTSMAAPHVSGAIALALAEVKFTSVKQVRDYIISGSFKVITTYDKRIR